MFGPSPHSAWKTADVDGMIGPLWGERDEAKRIAGYRAVDRYIAEKGLVIPVLQYMQPVVYRKGLKFTPHVAGFVLPQNVRPA
jgi:peptide/nickel transport system substrate-binding protein